MEAQECEYIDFITLTDRSRRVAIFPTVNLPGKSPLFFTSQLARRVAKLFGVTVPSHDKVFIGRDAKQPGRVASGQHCVILEASRRIFTGVSLRIKGHHVEIHGQLQIVESKARRRGITIKITKGLVFLPHSNFHDPRVNAPEDQYVLHWCSYLGRRVLVQVKRSTIILLLT